MNPHPKPGPKKKKRRPQDREYQAFIRSQPCIICGGSDTVHYHESLEGGSTGSKCKDNQSLPLCVRCHHYRHHYGRYTFYKIHDIDYKEEILKLQRRFEDDL